MDLIIMEMISIQANMSPQKVLNFVKKSANSHLDATIGHGLLSIIMHVGRSQAKGKLYLIPMSYQVRTPKKGTFQSADIPNTQRPLEGRNCHQTFHGEKGQ